MQLRLQRGGVALAYSPTGPGGSLDQLQATLREIEIERAEFALPAEG